MTETPRKHSVTLAGHRTSVTLEEPFWDELKRLARKDGRSVRALVEAIDETRDGNLSSAIRVHVLEALRAERGAGDSRARSAVPLTTKTASEPRARGPGRTP